MRTSEFVRCAGAIYSVWSIRTLWRTLDDMGELEIVRAERRRGRPRQSHCHNGHELSGSTLGFRGAHRYCKPCDRMSSQTNGRVRKAIQVWRDSNAKYGRYSFESGRAAEALAQISRPHWIGEATEQRRLIRGDTRDC